MKICVDSREHLKIPLFQDYISKGKSKLISGVEVGTYASGDAHSGDGLVGIERKAGDLLSSIYNDQLDKQLKELKDNFTHAYLFIEYEGIMDVICQYPNANSEMIMSKIASVLARKGVSICFVGQLYVPMVVKTIERFYDGKTPIKNIHYTPVRRKATAKEVKLDIISRIPKIGARKGLQLLETFDNSIGKISKAEIEELIKVPGIGKKLANEIKEVLK